MLKNERPRIQRVAIYTMVRWLPRYLVDQFANKWFPKGFRYFGRALILSLMDEPPRRVHNLPYPNIVVRKIMAFGFAALFYGKEHILPDRRSPHRQRSDLRKQARNRAQPWSRNCLFDQDAADRFSQPVSSLYQLRAADLDQLPAVLRLG